MTRRGLAVFIIASFYFTTAAQIRGKVISIADGDPFTMLVGNKQVKIRLHGVDCPENAQDFGNVAKEFLASYVFWKIVSVKDMDTDRYGRTIGMVTVEGTNVTEKLLEEGLAWHYKTFDLNSKWAKLEEYARHEKKGIWSHPNPIAPWEFRRMNRQ
jgi:micrococcal nuclease